MQLTAEKQAEREKTVHSRQVLFAALPPEWPEPLLPRIQDHIRASGRKVVVLDDDPTGGQTTHNLPVLTEWSVTALQTELVGDFPCFYILTNTRSLPLAEAQALNAEVGCNLAQAAHRCGIDFAVVCRGDSTLRGHYPGEMDALAAAIDATTWPVILVPFFLEGERFTLDNVHYVAEGDRLIPAGETQYARDAAFGYRASDLREWVEEKTAGRINSANVQTISAHDLRHGGPERICALLRALPERSVCAANAASYRDLEVLVAGLLDAESQGSCFLCRTAASFVRVRAGIAPRPLLTRAELGAKEKTGGLFVIGSYVAKSTAQVAALLNQSQVAEIKVNAQALLHAETRDKEITHAAEAATAQLASGRTAVIYTSREIITGADSERSLQIGKAISTGLVSIVSGIDTTPSYIVAKGGATASAVATEALSVRRALVLGQILPGVPVWQLGPESCFPGTPYVVFPGNVGGEDALARTAEIFG
jgi:uncharacterized protein YgbK (DUF1537 family)